MTQSEQQKQLRKQQRENLERLSQELKKTCKVIPTGHPMQPNLTDKAIKPFRKPLYNPTHNI